MYVVNEGLPLSYFLTWRGISNPGEDQKPLVEEREVFETDNAASASPMAAPGPLSPRSYSSVQLTPDSPLPASAGSDPPSLCSGPVHCHPVSASRRAP